MKPVAEAGVHATVVYCAVDRQWIVAVDLPAGSTLCDAVSASGLLAQVPELNAAALDVGVFNNPRDPDEAVREGDRIEIYRPMTIDPKEARRVRAEVRRRRKA